MKMHPIRSDEHLDHFLEGLECCDIIIGSEELWDQVTKEVERYVAKRRKNGAIFQDSLSARISWFLGEDEPHSQQISAAAGREMAYA